MLRRMIVLALAGIFFLTSGAGAAAASSASDTKVDVWVADWRENVFQDTKKPSEPTTKASLMAARNDIEPFQVNVRAPVDGKIINVAFSDLVCEGNYISAANMSYHYVEHIRSRTNSRYADATDPDAEWGDWDTKWVNLSNPMRKASADDIVAWPEILSNSQSKTIYANKTQPIWIKAYVPEDTAPGTYSGWMQIRTDLGNFDIDIVIEVMDVTIPDPSSMDAFSLEIWSQLVGNFDTAIDMIVDAYDVEVDSPEWWSIMESFAKLMKENRLNVLGINQTQLLLHGPDTAVDEEGNLTFDWSFFNKFVQFFLENGGIQQLSCGPLAKYKANPNNYDNDIPGEEVNDYTQAYIETIGLDADGKIERQLHTIDLSGYILGGPSPAMEYVEQYSASLYKNLTEQGWLDIFSHHIIDEPGKDHLASLYPMLEKVLSQGCPGIRTGDAFTVWTAEEQTAHTEMFSIILNSYEELQDRMAKVLKPGDTFWLYTSSVPIKDNYLNRTIDQPVWMMEMIGWLCFKRNATGYLHWGLNQWNTWTKNYGPYPNYPIDEMWDNTLGDSSCVYPDKANNSVRSSIRVEALREASELNSILSEAEKRDPEAVAIIVEAMVRGGTDYETDINKMNAARKAVLQLASYGEQTAFELTSAVPEAEIVEETIAENNSNFGWAVLGITGGAILLGGVIRWMTKKKDR